MEASDGSCSVSQCTEFYHACDCTKTCDVGEVIMTFFMREETETQRILLYLFIRETAHDKA